MLLLRLIFVLGALAHNEQPAAKRSLQLCEYVAGLYRKLTYRSDANLPRDKLALLDGRRLLFKAPVGQGKKALVYSVDAPGEEALAVKFARNRGGIVAIEEEWKLYEKLSPRERRFVLPIVEAPHSRNRGRVLLRPLLSKSRSLAAMLLSNTPLSPEEALSLCQILRWRDEFAHRFGAPLDANPTNLVLVNDPEDMARLNVSDPRFFLFEATTTTPRDAWLIDFLFLNALLKELDYCTHETTEEPAIDFESDAP